MKENPVWLSQRQLTRQESGYIMQAGCCLIGRKQALEAAEGRLIPEFPGAETLVAVVNVCLSIYEQYGAVEEQGATEEAWRMIALEKCAAIPGGLECATYCLEAWDTAQKEQQP